MASFSSSIWRRNEKIGRSGDRVIGRSGHRVNENNLSRTCFLFAPSPDLPMARSPDSRYTRLSEAYDDNCSSGLLWCSTVRTRENH
jgi:hypothetical protein